MGNNGTIIVMKIMCEYSLQINLNGLKQHIICDLNAIMCTICIVW